MISTISSTAAAPAPILPASWRAGRTALRHWRLLLIWALLSLAPAALMALPFWRILKGGLDFSVHAPALAAELDMVALADLYQHYTRSGAAVPLAVLLGMAMTLLLSPFFTGMAISAARAELRPGFKALIAGGLQEYPRMAHMLLVALLPLLAAVLLGGVARGMADRYGEAAVLASSAAAASMAATAVMALLLLLAHASIDAGRAILALDRRRRSAFKACWQGAMLLARHPLRTLGAYLPLTIAGLLVAGALALARAHVAGIDGATFAGALLLTQLAVLVLAWMRTARLFAMMELAAAHERR
jgi:hypothetical protein